MALDGTIVSDDTTTNHAAVYILLGKTIMDA
jgi:hypothetical protein